MTSSWVYLTLHPQTLEMLITEAPIQGLKTLSLPLRPEIFRNFDEAHCEALVDAPNLRVEVCLRADEHSEPTMHTFHTRNGSFEDQLAAICKDLALSSIEYELINWEIHHDA